MTNGQSLRTEDKTAKNAKRKIKHKDTKGTRRKQKSKGKVQNAEVKMAEAARDLLSLEGEE